MRAFTTLVALSVAMLGGVPLARAHIAVTSGPGFADGTQIVTLGVGHGCEGADTRSVRVEIPPSVVSVRPLEGDLGPASIELDDAGLVVGVTWEKPEERILPGDTAYYELRLRVRIPDEPFSTLRLPTHQVCETSDGTTTEVGWTSLEEDEEEGDEGPAPALRIVPKRFAGWNRFTVPVAIGDLSLFFSDAAIVWKDDAAYSANPTTAELIVGTAGVEQLVELAEGDEIWVKY